MPAAAIVTIVLVVVAILAIACYLILIGNVLGNVSSSLEKVIDSVAKISDQAKPIEPIITSINRDLGTGQGVLEDLLARKLGARAEAPAGGRRRMGK